MERIESLRIAGARTGAPTLVFLHEGLGSAKLWRDFPATLADRTGCPALVYSRLGNGFSGALAQPRTPDYLHREALVELPRLLAESGIGDAILIGQSDGASIAAIFAAEHPAVARGLVLEAPHFFVEECSLRSIAAIRRQYETTPLRARMARHHADADSTFYAWNDIWLAPAFRDWNIEAYAERLHAPILALQGRDDEYGTAAQLESLAAHAPSTVDAILLAGCGHAPHRDRRTLVEAAIAAWIVERI